MTFFGRLECCLIAEPVPKPQRDYEILIHLSIIKEGMQGERNSSIFVPYLEYSTCIEYFIYFLCFSCSILPVLKPQKDDVPLILLSSIGGTRI